VDQYGGVYVGPTGHGPGGAAPLGSGKAAEGASGTPSARGPGRRGRQRPSATRAAGIYTPWGMYIPPARPYIPPAEAGRGSAQGPRKVPDAWAAKAQSGIGRNAHPNQAPIRRDADTTPATHHTKNALATPEGVEGDTSQKLPPRAEKCSVHYSFSVDSPLRPRSPVEILGREVSSACSCG
jgi:hypothetical protein